VSAGFTLRRTPNDALTRLSGTAQQSSTRIHIKRKGTLCSRDSRIRTDYSQLSFVIPVLI
jgi:hypothetical protein